MINRTVIKNEPFSHCQCMTFASTRRTHTSGREDLGQRTRAVQVVAHRGVNGFGRETWVRNC
jgi:hypothetical protein